jgi:hypothetical protein
MPLLLLDVLRALWALRRDHGFVSLGLLLAIAIVGGAAFYWQVEDLRALDAVYLSVITLTTVGYGDPAPATDAGKIFTAAFVLVGMGILLTFLSTLAAQIRRNSILLRPLRRAAAGGMRQQGTALAAFGEYDLLVVGSDEASRRTALEAAAAGLRVVRPVHRYAPGSWGPDAVHDLITPRRWHLPDGAL